MAGKLDGTAIVSGSITSTQLSTSVNNSITQGGGPKITQIQITDSSYNVLDDTAVNTSGGYIKITGTGFNAGAVVIIGTVNATSTAYISSTTLNVQVPAAVAGTYVVYVVNTDGGTAIAVNGLTYSALPNWVTGSTLPSGTSTIPISIQLDATDATNYALAAGNTLPTGLTLTSGGLLSGTVTVGVETVYSFTVVATDAQLQDSPRSFTITITVGDPYFYLTTLLLAGNGTNNGTNNVFVDSSTNALAITRFGNTTQGTFTPFSLTGWSNYFDGVGDYLSCSPAVAASGNFTIEGWFLLTGTIGTRRDIIYQNSASVGPSEGRLIINLDPSGKISAFVGGTNSPGLITSTTTISPNIWYHFAYVRSSNTFSLYINGVREGTQPTGTISIIQEPLLIGYNPTQSPATYWLGYLSNIRIVNGTALYTANFTPPTSPLTAIANTSLLTCQSNRFLDNSTNNFTITRNGDVSVQAFSPFAPAASYSAGTVGGSSYYDGTADYLTIADNAGLDIGLSSTPFTLEFWVWFNNLSSSQTTYARGGGTGGWDGTSGWQWTNFYYSPDGSFYNQFWNGSSRTDFAFNFNSAGGKPMQWNHIAYSYNGSNYSCFVNGTRAATITASFGKPSSSNKTSMGAATGVVSGETNVLNGYISGFRIVKGTAVYNPTLSTLTVPTAPPTAVANTSLLLNFTNGQITDATSKNLLETVADAKISTAQSKWGGSSMYFDGTGDYLYPLNLNMLALGTQAFTIEFWFNTTSSTQYAQFIGNETTGLGFTILINQTSSTSGDIAIFNGASGQIHITSGTSYRDGNWHFLAFTRNSSGSRLFIDGVQQGSTNAGQSSTSFDGSPIRYAIGNNLQFAGRGYAGYLQDLRITRGYARYTSNFSVPTSAFPTL